MSNPFVILNLQTDGGQNLLEVGVVVVDARGMYELERWSSFVKSGKSSAPAHPCISARMTEQAPEFGAIAAHLHRILSNKIWYVTHVAIGWPANFVSHA